jgi:hypothetical protein
MRRLAPLLLLATACTTTPPPAATQTQSQPATTQTETADSRAIPIPARGVTCYGAVPIDATTEADGIAKENAYLADNYPGAKRLSYSVTDCHGTPAHKVDIETANGVKRSLFFDISKWTPKP